MYTNFTSQGSDRSDQQQQQQHQEQHNRSLSSSNNKNEDSAGALIDSYFLPGGILDPDEVASSQQQTQSHQQQRFPQQQSQQLHLYPGSSMHRHRSNSLNSTGAVGGVSLDIRHPSDPSSTNTNTFTAIGVGVSALDPSRDNFIEGDTIYYPSEKNGSTSHRNSNLQQQQRQQHQQHQHLSTLAELNNQSFTRSQQEDLFRNSNRNSISSVTAIQSTAHHDMTTIGGNWLTSQHNVQQTQQQQQQHQQLHRGSLNSPLPQAQPIGNKNPWGNKDANTDLLMNVSNLQHSTNAIIHPRKSTPPTTSGNVNNSNDVSFLFNNNCSRNSLGTSSTSNKSLLSSNQNPQSIATQQHQHISHQNKQNHQQQQQQQQVLHHKNNTTLQHKSTPVSASFQRPPPGFSASMVSNGDHHLQQQQRQKQAHLNRGHYQNENGISESNVIQPSTSTLHNPRHQQQQQQQQQHDIFHHQQSQSQRNTGERDNNVGRTLEEQHPQQSLHRTSQQRSPLIPPQQQQQQHHHTQQHISYNKSKQQNSTFVQNHQHINNNNNRHKFDEDYDLGSLNSKTSRDVPSTIYVPEEDAISNSDTLTICADSVTETSVSNNLMGKKSENGKAGGAFGVDVSNNERKMSVLEETSQSVNEKRSKSKRQKKKRNKKRQQNQNSQERSREDGQDENDGVADQSKSAVHDKHDKDVEDHKDKAMQHNNIPDLSSSTGEGEKHDYANRTSWTASGTAATSSTSKATTIHRRPGRKSNHNKNQFHHQQQQREEKGSRNDNYHGNKKNSSKQRNDPIPREPLWDQLMEKLRALRPIVFDCAHLLADYSSTLGTQFIKWIVSFCPQRERFWFFVPLFCISLDMSFLVASMITALIGKLMYICLLMHKLAFLEMLECDSATLCYTMICLYPSVVTIAKDSLTFEEYWTVFIRWFAVDRLLCRPIRMKDTFLNRIKDEDRQRLVLNTYGSKKAKRKRITMKDVARLIIKFRAKEDQEETERVTMANHILLILRKITPLVLMIEVNVRRQGFLMSMSKTERILLSYGFAVIRSGYLFSPLIWMSWTLQLTVIMFAPASEFWAYLLMLVGLSAIRLSHYTASVEDLEGIYISYRDDDDHSRKKDSGAGLFD